MALKYTNGNKKRTEIRDRVEAAMEREGIETFTELLARMNALREEWSDNSGLMDFLGLKKEGRFHHTMLSNILAGDRPFAYSPSKYNAEAYCIALVLDESPQDLFGPLMSDAALQFLDDVPEDCMPSLCPAWEREELREALERVSDGLDSSDQSLLKARFSKVGRTLEQIGADLGVTKEAIRKREERILESLRFGLEELDIR